MPAQTGYYNTLKSAAGKVLTYLNTITFTGTDGKTLTVTQDTSLDEAVAMSSKATQTSGTWTPQISSSAGTITTVGAVSGTWVKTGESVTITFSVAITTNGTGSGYIFLQGMADALPVGAIGTGVESNQTGKGLVLARFASGTFWVKFYDGTYPGGDLYILQGTATYVPA